VASNNDLDMIGELRVAALLAKGVAGDATKVPAYQALRMATINGAKALGLAAETGSIETGKAADLVAVDLEPPATSPVYSPISQLVYAASRDQVTDVWVGGQLLLREGQLTTLDQEAIAAQIREWQHRITNPARK
jgi:5-methylthioadenosine/S-adenosylhomocysteine deaminase